MVSTLGLPEVAGVAEPGADDPVVDVFVGVGVPFFLAPDSKASSDTS
ncbi:MAG: hypothetical protein M1582_00935 [Actinobacteria bacterium]|nr:hypothetical protein [Actinomycetota bacterium]